MFAGISGAMLVNAAAFATTPLWPIVLPLVVASGVSALLAGRARATKSQVEQAALIEAAANCRRIVDGLRMNPGLSAYPYESLLLDEAVALHAKGLDLDASAQRELRASFVRHFVGLVGDDARSL